MAIQAASKKLIDYNSQSNIYRCMYNEKEVIVKHRFINSNSMNSDLMGKHTTNEAKSILKCKTIGIAVPTLYSVDLKNFKIVMENITGQLLHNFLKYNYKNTEAVTEILFEIGVILRKMHKNNVSHGDMNTSNILLKKDGSIVLMNFGLSCLDASINDKVLDLYTLEQSLINTHWQIADKFSLIFISYKEIDMTYFTLVLKKLNHLKTSSKMVDTKSKNEQIPNTRQQSKNEITPKKSLRHKDIDKMTLKQSLRFKNMDEMPLKENDMFSCSSNKTTEKPHEIKLNIRRINDTSYVSMFSPPSLNMLEKKTQDNESTNTLCVQTTPKKNIRKSLRWSERHDNNVMNLVDEVMNNSNKEDEDEILNIPKKYSAKVPILCSSDSNDSLETLSSKRITKPVERFGESVDLNKIIIENTPPESRRTRRTSASLSTSKLNNIVGGVNTLKSVTPKRSRKTVHQLEEPFDSSDVDIVDTPSKIKRTRASTTSCKLNDLMHSVDSVTQKHSVDTNEVDILNTPKSKRTLRTSASSTRKSNNIVNILESVTPKRVRKSTCRFGVSEDFNEIETMHLSKSNKKGRKMSFSKVDEHKDLNFEIEIDTWNTPVNKHLKPSITPNTRSGSKVRRSILQDIPENKQIEVVSTPKTPRKTPKAHVKNLTASASKRLDSGARIPCSPLEKARASLHLHAAPKHLPCRETEFKTILSFLARKINDELTGSMYISGVPGTGKTATVKRVIDTLNKDLIMKYSFKFIELNGLRLANPHQAFSDIWKELTEQKVSSSKAQALLNDYFSGKEVRETSTILLVDEVDHICNRKQDVVYNILDWPSRTGSKVVVITIANTMDLPERVLRGCVTSRMGLTRLVFKPYTFQQLQEIIMNRLIGNSLFDPDAVQLVSRKVAAVSGDARRALDICRRALDLIKSDDSQLITINHVNQVLNSILSGVRVSAIRHCTVIEQLFLRAVRDETTRTGFDHSTIDSVYNQMKSICLLEGEELPSDQQVIMMSYRLRDSGLIFLEKKRWDLFRKVSLNVSPEDISYALDKYNK